MNEIKNILSEAYRITSNSVCPMQGGWSALAFLVTDRTGRKFVLKVYEKSRFSTLKLTARIEEYMSVAKWLNSNTPLHNKIINPVKTAFGKYKYENEEAVFLLTNYIEGDDLTGKEPTPDQVIELADIVADLHLYGIDIPVDTSAIRETFETEFCPFVRQILYSTSELPVDLSDLLSCYSTEIKQATDRLEIGAKTLRSRPREDVLCHTDIHGGNILSGKEGLVLIDWENLKQGPREADFFSLIKKPWFDLFWEGYKRKHPDYEIDEMNLSFYTLRRKLEDISEFIEQLCFDVMGDEARSATLNLLREECGTLNQ